MESTWSHYNTIQSSIVHDELLCEASDKFNDSNVIHSLVF